MKLLNKTVIYLQIIKYWKKYIFSFFTKYIDHKNLNALVLAEKYYKNSENV